MGNSGSIHNIAAEIEDLSPHFQQHGAHLTNHQPLKWTQSYPRENFQQQSQQSQQQQQQQQQHQLQQHIKVLPDLNENPRLRFTTNGAILQSGGTISGRKDLITAPPPPGVLQRSRTSIHYDLKRNSSNLYNRSQTKLSLIQDSQHHSQQQQQQQQQFKDVTSSSSLYKRFGSEPDLRFSGDEEVGGSNQAKTSKSKMVKTKKKKAAPLPPQDALELNQINSNEIMSPAVINSGQQKKLRLFKTKAESKKSSIQYKLNAEASDLHFKRSTLGNGVNQLINSESSSNLNIQCSQANISDSKRLQPSDNNSNWQESKVKVLPVAAFRREKSFDVSLLHSHNRLETEDAISMSRERQRTSINLNRKSSPAERSLIKRQNSIEPPERTVRNSVLDTKLSIRKYSQPAQLTSIEFKKELEEATKRRNADKKEKDLRTRPPAPPTMTTTTTTATQPVPKQRTIITKGISNIQGKNSNCSSSNEKLHKNNNNGNGGNNNNNSNVSDIQEIVKKRNESKIPQLMKTFYFGMDGSKKEESKKENLVEDFGKIQLEVIDEFAKNILKNQRQKRAESESSESALSSEEGCPISGGPLGGGDYDENTTNGGIHVHVRPTLPRRQLEIPRFSPSAAWRMLNDDQQKDSNIFDKNANHFVSELVDNTKQQPLEEQIQRIYREPHPLYTDNKSGDSGISGDAGLPDRTESPRQHFVNEHDIERGGKVEISNIKPWVPQQDLEEEEEEDEEEEEEEEDESNSEGEDRRKVPGINKFSNRGHIFSLSLPRESHLSNYEEKEKPGFSSLQKLKKTVSNVFFNTPDRITSYQSDNWLLSRSAPNSIENSQMLAGGGGIHQQQQQQQQQQHQQQQQQQQQQHQIMMDHESDHRQLAFQPSSFSYFTGGKHVMYLPNHPIGESTDYQDFDYVDGEIHKTKLSDIENCGKFIRERKYSSKYNNKVSQGNSSSKKREEFQEKTKGKANSNKSKGHRFTFQSTVRQIERRRIAERLSKEAEEKEAQRLSELEAMKKVEEEFQRKRAREKASIRHQLRLFSLEENQCTSLPIDWQQIDENNIHQTQYRRAEPDGAVSSPTSSQTSPDSPMLLYNDRHDDLCRKNDGNCIMKNHNHRYQPILQVPCTEVLSEFHTMRREYHEYRNDKRKISSDIMRSELQTDHPPLVYQIPSTREVAGSGDAGSNDVNMYCFDDDLIGGGGGNTGTNSNAIHITNYRRDFSRGRSICSSESELSVPSGDNAIGNRRSRHRCKSPSPSL